LENDRPDAKKIVANIGWLSLDKLLHMLVGLLVGVWIARYLGPDQFGLLSYAQAFVALFSALASLGLDGIVVRNIVRNPDIAGETLGTAFIMRMAAGLLTFCITMSVIYIMYPHDPLIRLLVGIIAAGTVFQAFDTIDLLFQARVSSRYTVYAKNAAFLAVSLLKVVLILKEASLVAFALAGLAEVVIGAAGMLLAYSVAGRSITGWRMNLKRGRELIGNSWPLILSGIVVMIYMRIDQIMLREMLGTEAVGIYSAATRISEIWYFFPTAIVSSVFPSIIQAKQVSEELYNRRLQKLFVLMAALAYAIAIPMTFMSGWVIDLLYGNKYFEAGPVLSIHIWASVFVFLQISTGSWFINENLQIQAFFRYLSGAILNVFLNLLLIPYYGVKGAAISTICSFGLVVLSPIFFSPSYRKLSRLIIKAIILKWKI